MAEQPEHLTTTEARGATGSRMTRQVLVISLALVVAIFAALLFLWH